MGSPLPRVLGSISDSTKIRFSSIANQMAELKYLNASPANFSNFGAAWTEVDSGANVNVDGNGVLTIVGNGAYQANGMIHTLGVSRAEGFLEFKISIGATAAVGSLHVFNSSATLPSGAVAGTYGGRFINLAAQVTQGTQLTSVNTPISTSTFYTIRVYVLKSADGTTWAKARVTIQGGTYANETLLYDGDGIQVAHGSTLYFTIQRQTATNATTYKEIYWYSGYATDSPFVEYKHDAGLGKVFDGFDLTNFAMPGTIPTTNLQFAYYFGDSATPSYSTAKTMAQLQAVGKITERHRYIFIKVLAVSDGATQVYIDKPNSATAIDGIGDYPEVVNVLPNDTVQGVQGTSDKVYSVSEAAVIASAYEASRNEAVLPVDYRKDKHILNLGNDVVGLLSAGTLLKPATPKNLTPIATSSISIDLSWDMSDETGGPAATYETEIDGVVTTGIVGLIKTYSSLTPDTEYSFRVRAKNEAGESDWSEIKTGRTSPVITAPTPIEAPFSFYNITTGNDGAAVETLLIANCYGSIDIIKANPAMGQNFDNFIMGYLFIPSKNITGIDKGQKVVDANGNILVVELFEDLEEHQEITLRKVNS